MRLTNPFIGLGKEQGIQVGREEGLEKGRHAGEVALVLRLLVRRLGILPTSQKRKIERLELSKIEALGESLLEFKSRADLARWLKTNASQHVIALWLTLLLSQLFPGQPATAAFTLVCKTRITI